MKTSKDSTVFNAALVIVILAVAFFVSVVKMKERFYDTENSEIKEVFSQSGGNSSSESIKHNDTFYELFER